MKFKKRINQMNEAYKNLQKDPQDWNDMIEERNELEGTIGDGLEIIFVKKNTWNSNKTQNKKAPRENRGLN